MYGNRGVIILGIPKTGEILGAVSMPDFEPDLFTGRITEKDWKDDTGLKIDKSSDAEVIDGGFQDVGHGMQVRFSPGVYTINDEWELEISGIVDSRTMAVKYAEAERI